MTGLGVLIKTLGGNAETIDAIRSSIGKTIKDVRLSDNTLIIQFVDGIELRMFDDGQSCCEFRYMRTDDNLSDYIGATLQDFELKNAPSVDDDWGSHEIQFLDVVTSKGIFQMANHNEHNGYYGGFYIVATVFENN